MAVRPASEYKSTTSSSKPPVAEPLTTKAQWKQHTMGGAEVSPEVRVPYLGGDIKREPIKQLPYVSRAFNQGKVYKGEELKPEFWSTKKAGKKLLEGALQFSPYEMGKKAIDFASGLGKKAQEFPKQASSFLKGETKQDLSPELESLLAQRPEVTTPKEQLKTDWDLIKSGKIFKAPFDKDVSKLAKPQVGIKDLIEKSQKYKSETSERDKYLDFLKQSKEMPFRTGVAEGMSLVSPEFIAKKTKKDMIQEFGETPFSVAQKTSPVAYTGGNVFGNVAKYGTLYSTLGSAIGSSLTAKGAFASTTPFAQELLIEGIKDLAISMPLSITEGLMSGLKGKELVDFIIEQMAIDAITNAGIYGLGKVLKPLSNAIDTAKNSPEVVKAAENSAKTIEVKQKADVQPFEQSVIDTQKTTHQLLVQSEKTGVDNSREILKALDDFEVNALQSYKNQPIYGEKLLALSENLNKSVVKSNDGVTKSLDTLNTKLNTMAGTSEPKFKQVSEAQLLQKQPSKQVIGDLKQRKQNTFTDIAESADAMLRDQDGIYKKVGENVYDKASKYRRVDQTTHGMATDKMVDMQGNEIGKGLRDVFEQVPKAKTLTAHEYLYHKLNVSRARRNKNIFTDFSSKQSAKKVALMEVKDPWLKKFSTDVRGFYDNLGEEWLVKGGLVPEETYLHMRDIDPDYIYAKNVVDSFENYADVSYGTGSTLKKAKHGGKTLGNPMRNADEYKDAIVRAVRRNEILLEMAENARKNPKALANMVEIKATPDELVRKINNALESGDMDKVAKVVSDYGSETFNKGGTNTIYALDNGVPVGMEIKNRQLWNTVTRPAVHAGPGAVVGKIGRQVTSPFKQLITQKNPFFGARNVPRDLSVKAVFSATDSPVKLAKEYASSAKDIMKKTDLYKQYVSLGGPGANFITANGKSFDVSKLLQDPSLARKALNSLEDFNNFGETIPRFGEFKTVYEATGDLDKALRAAAEITVDFSRGGWLTKYIGNFVPYFNASVQGLDKVVTGLFAEGGKNFLKRSAKGVLYITAPSIALHMMNRDNENYKALSNRQKDSYYNIPNYNDLDESGTPKTFVKIPKSRELGVLFGALFERILRQVGGEEDAFKGFGSTFMQNFGPVNPATSNIASPLMAINPFDKYDVGLNKDWAGRSIVPMGMQSASPGLQYDEKTSEIAKKLGGALNFSPKQIDYLIDSYTGIVGDILIPATTKGGSPMKAITNQFIADPLFSNQSISDFYDFKEEVTRTATDRNIRENIPSEALTKEEKVKSIFTKASRDISEYYDAISRIEYSDMPRSEKDQRVAEIRKKIIEITTSINEWYKKR